MAALGVTGFQERLEETGITIPGWDTSQTLGTRTATPTLQLQGCLAAIAEVLSQLQELRQDMCDRFESQSQEFHKLHEGLRYRPSPSGSSRKLREEKGPDATLKHGSGFTASNVHGLAEELQKQLIDAVDSHPQVLEASGQLPPSPAASSPPPHPFGVLPEPAAAPLGATSPQREVEVPSSHARAAFSEQPQVEHRPSFQQHPRRSQSSLPKGSVDTLRRQVEQEIVERGKTADKMASAGRMASVPELRSVRAPRWRLLEAAAVGLDHVNLFALKLGGVLPWCPAHFRPSLLYQWLVLLLQAAITIYFVVQAQSSLKVGRPSPFLFGDLVLAFGSLGALLSVRSFARSGPLEQSLRRLEDAVLAQGFKASVCQATAFDTLATLGVWLAFLSDRLGSLYALSGGDLPTEDLVQYVAVVLASGQLAILVLAVLRITRHMAGLVDAFASGFCATLHVPKAVSDWNVLQASIRMASNAVEWCFAVLLSTMVLQALAIVFDLRALMGSAWALTASGLLILGLTQILLRAAAVTDACIRVPQLVNSTAITDAALDEERMYLVDYITASAAGFYIFNVRLGAGIGMKVLHYTGLMAFTIARLVLPSSSPV